MTDTARDSDYRLTERGRMNLDALALQAELRERVEGEVRFDAGTRAAYAHDASNYRQVPFGVVIPQNTDDVMETMAACRKHGAPVLMRGAGTSLSGETTNVAVVLDVSKYMDEILEINPDERYARIQPGVIRDQLSHYAEEQYQLTFAPDTSTHQWAVLGGMIGNNSCGVHSVMAGRTSDNVEELEIALYDGSRMTVGNHTEQEADEIIRAGGRKGEIYGQLRDLRDKYADQIRSRYPDIPRRVSGYNLDELLPENGLGVARALVGTEGTCVTILEAKLRLVYSPPARSLLVLGYPSVYEAGDHVSEIMAYGPTGLEGLDRQLISDMQAEGMHPTDIEELPEGNGWLLVEFGGETSEESHAKARKVMDELKQSDNPPSMRDFEDPEEANRIWGIRESGLGATAYIPGVGDHWPGWEDSAVPPQSVGDYLRDLRALFERYGYDAALYGHFGQGCIHCRISFDLKTAEGLSKWRAFMEEAADLVVSYGGSLSGEHGDGQQRAELLPKMYGEELMAAFREFRAIWDPDSKMNPGKVIDARRMTDDLRFGTDYNPENPETHFSYPEDGGSFAHATMRCVGVGLCRDAENGTMCPSYMATKDEKHTTRGRARILHEMLRHDENSIQEGFKSEEVFDALDLCLSCKGCKSDCPVNVDMATYKAEFLSKYYKGRLRPAYAYTMGLIMLHARLAKHAPRLANLVTHAPGIGKLVKKAGGIAPQREMPPFAHRTFKDWFAGREPKNLDGPPVVLFPDTFNDFLHPEPAKAAVEVLEAGGYRVIVPREPLCCGRPLYDYGMLDTARLFLNRLVQRLAPYVREGIPVVGIEPSCVATFRDELPNMMPHDEDAKRLTNHTYTLAEFLSSREDYDPPKLDRKAVVHGHCHGKSIMGMGGEQKLLEKMGLDFEVLDSGCCGVAGSFGFEHDHYEVSMQVGEHKMLPMVRETGKDTLLISDGFSCKTQVEHATDRRGLHVAQVLKMALEYGESGAAGDYPERHYPDVVTEDGRGRTAALAAGAVLTAGALAWKLNRRRKQ